MGEDAVGAQQLKYLEMIEGVITRMADNQFKLRGFSVALGTAIIGFSAKDNNAKVALLAILPALTFWILDSYYLALERCFRNIFRGAPKDGTTQPDFSLATSGVNSGAVFAETFRPAVWLVHAPVVMLAIIVGAWGWLH
jgi:hypothetical protein